jgi:predicted metal-dependent TIM-barrel fold hydrolase
MFILQAIFIYDRLQIRRSTELQANLEVARAMAQAFEEFIQDIIHQELAIGINLRSSESLTAEEMNRILRENKAEFPSLRDISWLSPQGRVMASSRGRK